MAAQDKASDAQFVPEEMGLGKVFEMIFIRKKKVCAISITATHAAVKSLLCLTTSADVTNNRKFSARNILPAGKLSL